MEKYIFIIFILLCFALLLSLVKRGKYVLHVKILRFFIILVPITFFTFWFIKKSTFPLIADSIALQISNKLPQTIDFYVIEILNKKTKENDYEVRHSGKIHSNFYRNENLKMKNSDEYWIAGYLGKNDMVYFSQHAVGEKITEQKVEVNNYIIQSQKLSKIAEDTIAKKRLLEISKSVSITLSLLLAFLNIVLLIRRT